MNVEHLTSLAEAIITTKANSLIGQYGYQEQDREDLKQDLWVHVWPRIASYTEGSVAPSTYVTHAVNQATREVLAHRTRHRRHYQRTDISFDETNPHHNPPVGSAMEQAEVTEAVQHAYRDMTEAQQRICQELADGNSKSQIAILLGINRHELGEELERIRKVLLEHDLDAFV